MSSSQGSSLVSSFMGLTISHIEPLYTSTDSEKSAHIPELPQPGPPVAYGWTDVDPETEQKMGSSQTYYRFQVEGTQAVDKCTYHAVLSALTAGAGGNSPSYIDHTGPMLVEEATQYFNTKIVQQMFGEAYIWSSERELDPDSYADLSMLERRNIAVATRRTDAAAQQEVICDLPFWFTHHSAQAWHQWLHSQSSSCRFGIKTRSSTQMLQQLAANTKPTVTAPDTDYIVSSFLRFRVWAIPSSARKAVRSYIGGGHQYITYHQQAVEADIGAADTSITLDLRPVDGFCAYSIAALRTASLLDGSSYITSDRTTYLPYTSRSCRGNGLDFIPEHTYAFVEYADNSDHFPGNTGYNTCTVIHAPNPSFHYDLNGGYDYHAMNNKTQTINFAAPGAAAKVHYWAFTRQIVEMLPDALNSGTFMLKAKYNF